MSMVLCSAGLWPAKELRYDDMLKRKIFSSVIEALITDISDRSGLILKRKKKEDSVNT